MSIYEIDGMTMSGIYVRRRQLREMAGVVAEKSIELGAGRLQDEGTPAALHPDGQRHGGVERGAKLAAEASEPVQFNSDGASPGTGCLYFPSDEAPRSAESVRPRKGA